MVFVDSLDELLIGDSKKMLLRELQSLAGKGNLDEAFATWLLGSDDIPFNLTKSASSAAEHVGGQRKYRDVALLGFAAASNLLKDAELNSLKDGITWVVGREPWMNGNLQGFCTDVIALLGIVLGAKALEDSIIIDHLCKWISKFINTSFQSRLDEWQKCLFIAICQIQGIYCQEELATASNLADIRLALYSKRVLSYKLPSEEQDKKDTIVLIKSNSSENMTGYFAAFRLAAFNSIQDISSTINLLKPSVEDVVKVLNRVPTAIRRWTWESKPRTRTGESRKWHIDNEYHVQNLLYSLLAPIFPDLEDEGSTPSVGQMHPRADLLIPSLSLIIEVKFMRATSKPQHMIEEIAADCSLYLVDGSIYRGIVAFIWDNSARSQEHEYMRNGLKQLPGLVDAVVVSRPGDWSEEEVTSSEPPVIEQESNS